MQVPQGTFDLHRFPRRPNETLRAWDAADEYLLQALAGRDEVAWPHSVRPEAGLAGNVVIFNDSFGALGVALQRSYPLLVSDSQLALLGAEANLKANLVIDSDVDSDVDSDGGVRTAPSTEDLSTPADLVLLKVPKSLALLETQLRQVRRLAHPATQIMAAAMVRHVHDSTLEVFERVLGPTTTSLARKKARLILPTIDLDRQVGPSSWPRIFTLADGMTVVSYAGVFAAGKLDRGTRLLLENLPTCPPESKIVDLGCGNGALGTALATPDSSVIFLDKSFLALASAEATNRAAYQHGDANFLAGDGADGVAPNSVDIAVCNPPFHDDQALSEATGWKLLTDAHRILKPGGEFRMVGNRHLGYHAKLAKIFGNRATVASSNKFVVLSARKWQTGH